MADQDSKEAITLSPEIIEQLTKIASDAAHGAITKRNKSFEEKFDSFTQSVEQRFSPKQDEAKENEEKKTLTQRMAALEEDNRKLREANHAEKQRAAEQAMRSRLQEALAKSGISAVAQQRALSSLLIHDEKLVSLDKNGAPVFKMAGYDNETVPLEEGLTEWLQSDGKDFVPSVPVKGAGQRNVKSQGNNKISSAGFKTQAEADEVLGELLRQSR